MKNVKIELRISFWDLKIIIKLKTCVPAGTFDKKFVSYKDVYQIPQNSIRDESVSQNLYVHAFYLVSLLYYVYEKFAPQAVDIVKVDLLLAQEISKRHFLRDIEKSFQEVTPMGPKTLHFFFFLKYLNKYGC